MPTFADYIELTPWQQGVLFNMNRLFPTGCYNFQVFTSFFQNVYKIVKNTSKSGPNYDISRHPR